MKKIYFLLILFLLLLIPKSVSALSFDVNSETYQVFDATTLRDYCYYTYVKPYNEDYHYNHLIVYINSAGHYQCAILQEPKLYNSSTDPVGLHLYHKNNLSSSNTGGGYYTLQAFNYQNFSLMTGSSYVVNTWSANGSINLMSNVNIIFYTSFTTEKNNRDYLGNYTFQDIENKYNPVEEPTDLNIDFPISKEDFYVLLVLVATLIMMLFLKWCFPFKMGGDLK